MRVISWMVVLGFATACGPRFEVVGPRAATATRDVDGHVTVTAVLTCVDANDGDGGDCDGDGKSVCVLAGWFTPQPAPTDFRANTVGCVTPSRVEGTLVVIRSEVPIPQGSPLKIELTRELSGGDGPRVVIDSP
jgi:hypothetical protein